MMMTYSSKHHSPTQKTWKTKNGAVALSTKRSINFGMSILSLGEWYIGARKSRQFIGCFVQQEWVSTSIIVYECWIFSQMINNKKKFLHIVNDEYMNERFMFIYLLRPKFCSAFMTSSSA